ncbi:hypothetical protein RHODGE_RHODGE_02838 [Rhodoplanes serenus]|uniref:Tip attachment protein J central straight fiber domain-containing protein n=1 Tax=Rhodoplanes serenus TaxID=200615 RepID=A0A447CWJ3_9BRAD|nr:hypothetical protein RHODGE_RHODGE_02838 [Rhodoplanes serenus]
MTTPEQPTRARKARRPGATVIARTVMGTPVGEPIRLSRRRRTLAAVMARCADPRRPHMVSVHRPGEPVAPEDHTVVLRAAWATTLVRPDEIVLITYIPLGGGGAGGQSTAKQIGSAVAMLALAAIAPYAAPALLAGASSATGLLLSGNAFLAANYMLQAGLVVGGAYAISLATRAKANSQDSDTRPVYGVSGGGNLPRQGDRIPVGYGRFWSQPDLTQPDYTQFDGEDQILYKKMTLGVGRYDVEEIHVGKSVLWTKAGGVQPPFNTVPGGGGGGGRGDSLGFVSGEGGTNVGLTAVEIIPPGGTSTLVPGSVYSHPSVVGIELPRPGENPSWSGPFASCEPGRTTSKIQLDYELPMGVANTGTSEPNYPGNWSVVFQIAPCDQDDVPTGPWATLHVNGGTHYWSRAQRFTRSFDVAPGRYLVRAQNAQPYRDILVNTVVWSGLRSHFPETIVRPHVTEIALRIRSGKALGVTAFADVWVKATRILRVWDSDTETWTEQPTRKAVWAYLDVMTADYGEGLPDYRVDVTTIAARAASLVEDDTFDGVIRGPVPVQEVASVVLGPLRAEPVVIASIWSLVRDEPKVVRKHVFTRRQIKRGTSMAEFQIARDDGPADVIVEYHPDADPRRRREVRRTIGAATQTPQRIKAEGIASWSHAARYATYRAAAAFYRRQSRTFTTDRQGRLVGRGDPIVADVWFLESARTGGVMARDGLDLALDTAMEVGADTYAYLRDRRGRDWGPVKVTQPDPEAPNVIALDAADVAAVEAFHGQSFSDVLAHDNEDMTTVRVGPLAVLQRSYLVRSVRPSGLDAIEIECRHDAPEVWTALAEPLPPEPVVPSIGDAADPAYPTVPWVRARCIAKAANLAMEWACGTARGAASYVVMLSYDDGATWEEVSDGLVTSGSYQIRHEPGAQVKVLAYAIGTAGSPGPTVFTMFTTFAATVAPENMEEGLRRYVTERVGASQRAIETLIQRVAALAAEVDAATWRDRQQIKSDLQSQSEQAWAGISTVQTVATSNTAALASLSTTVTARFGTLEASVQQVQAAVADVDGKLGAIWGVKVDAGRRVQSLYLFDDGTTAGVAFTVDTFTIALGSNGPEAAVPAFVAVVEDGVPTFAFNGTLKAGSVKAGHIAAGSITAEKVGANEIITQSANIKALTVDTINIKGGAVGVYRAIESPGIGGGGIAINPNWTTAISVQIQVSAPAGEIIPIFWAASYRFGNVNTNTIAISVRLWIAGTLVNASGGIAVAPGTWGPRYTIDSTYHHTASGGTDTIQITLQFQAGDWGGLTETPNTVSLAAFKR